MSMLHIIMALNKTGGSSTPPPEPDPVHTLIDMRGESNIAGQAENTDLDSAELLPRPLVQILNNTSLLFEDLEIGVNNSLGHTGIGAHAYDWHGMEAGLANAVEAGDLDDYAVSPIHLVKNGHGGAKIDQLSEGGNYMGTDCWQLGIDRLAAANTQLASLYPSETIRKVMWFSQGINDSVNGTNPIDWKPLVINYFAAYRALNGDCKIYMTKFYEPLFSAFNDKIDEIAAEVDDCWAIDTAGAELAPDNYHWTDAGIKEVANRIIAQMLIT